MTFSHTSALGPGFVGSRLSSSSPAVWSFWLWHVMQYCSKTALGAADVAGDGTCCVCQAEVWTVDKVRAMQPLTTSAEILCLKQGNSLPLHYCFGVRSIASTIRVNGSFAASLTSFTIVLF